MDSSSVRSSPKSISLVLVDEYPACLTALSIALSLERDIDVLGESLDLEAGLALAQRTGASVMLLGFDGPENELGQLLDTVRKSAPSLGLILVTSGHGAAKHLSDGLTQGIRGFLTRWSTLREMVEAIRVVASGGVYIEPALASSLGRGQGAGDAASALEKLSAREREVLTALAEGCSGKEVAARTRLSVKTVATYKERIRTKLGLSHRTDYVRFALDAGILGPRKAARPAASRPGSPRPEASTGSGKLEGER